MTVSVTTIVGARPQLVKAAVVSAALVRAGVRERMIDTGQHYDADMSTVFYEELDLAPPALDLHVREASHGAMTARMLEGIEIDLVRRPPDWVLVYGDTNSTLAGALAAAKLNIPVAHIEAGLRSFNRSMPEETNRVVTDHVASLLFAPTDHAVANLAREGIPSTSVVRTGDVMYDAALLFGSRADRVSDVVERLGLDVKSYVLVTVHRAANTDDPDRLQSILAGLNAVAERTCVVWPVHPRTAKAIQSSELHANVLLLPPVGYLDMVRLERCARLIATDSGGVQKEAFFHRVPCATLREETEWGELIELGWNRLVPPSSPKTVAAGLLDALDAGPGTDAMPYGDGLAADAIAAELVQRGEP